jgi:hypothetical protein
MVILFKNDELSYTMFIISSCLKLDKLLPLAFILTNEDGKIIDSKGRNDHDVDTSW